MYTPFLNVTVPVDGSEAALRGIAAAIASARAGTALHFCSVVDLAAAGFGPSIGASFDPIPIVEASEDDARRACAEAVALAGENGVAADGKVLYGAVAPGICRYAKELGSDTIVIGTHAQQGISRLVFGSIAESVSAISNVPVVLVPR
jgi:nucleotide-binding universal stress UspA family protein